jgi:hypothetical protein
MLWFTKDKRSRMTHRYKERTRYAALLKRDLDLHDALPALIGLAEAGFSRVEGDEHEFVLLFREPMPDQLRIAVHLETDLWVALRTTLDAAKNAGITAQEYDRLLPQLRENLSKLGKVLDLEAEIMYSPLRNHFIDELVALRKATP